ncbi:MAG TPA: DUF1269 domain-containing protein [Candidatus Limnocylindrales bacterium]|jgi:uncharacterized membrane protein
MSAFVAITFANEDSATRALHAIRSLEKEGQIGLEDTAVATKDADGKVQVKNEMASGTESGALVGAILGSLLFVVFPVGAIVGGAIAGGLIGRAVKPGIDGKFVKEVEENLAPGGSAIFLLTKGGNPGLLIAAMRPYEGTVVQTTLDDEEEQALRDSLK